VMRFIPQQDEFPGSERLPMQQVEIELPIKTSAIATAPSAVSMGQDLSIEAFHDPYWFFVMGMLNYGSSSAFNMQTYPTVIDTEYNYNNRKEWQWYARSFKPEKQINNGWLHVNYLVDNLPEGEPNAMRTFVNLPNYKGKMPPLNGHVWSGGGPMLGIYVNGRPLNGFAQQKGYAASHEGSDFNITESDGLVRGANVVDFVWSLSQVAKIGLSWYVMRVDFNSIYRETHDR